MTIRLYCHLFLELTFRNTALAVAPNQVQLLVMSHFIYCSARFGGTVPELGLGIRTLHRVAEDASEKFHWIETLTRVIHFQFFSYGVPRSQHFCDEVLV